jgi:hypothetical protein
VRRANRRTAAETTRGFGEKVARKFRLSTPEPFNNMYDNSQGAMSRNPTVVSLSLSFDRLIHHRRIALPILF